MRQPTFVALTAALVAAAACGPPPGPSGGGVPPGAVPLTAMSDRDPVGFLLQIRDSLGLNDTVAMELVRLNLRLFRRNRETQMHLDSLLRSVPAQARQPQRGDTTGGISPELREKVAPLQARLRDQTAAARDTAWAMLTPDQRNIAAAMELRFQEMMRRRASGGGTTGRP